MAETKPKTSKRRVKNPESFRERAIKAAEGSERPARAGRVKQSAANVLSPVSRPVRQGAGRVFGLRPFRLLGKILLPSYLRNSWRELKLVNWPNWRESRRLTFAVLLFAVVFGASIALVDYGLDKIFRAVLLK